MRKLLLICIITSFAGLSVRSQYFDYGRKMTDTLASEYLFGRGYLKEGIQRAAYMIATEFYKMKLKKFAYTNMYYHNFSYPVNAFPKELYLAFDENFMTLGVDFIPSADCPTVKGTFDFVRIDSVVIRDRVLLNKIVSSKLNKTVVILDDKGLTSEDEKKLVNSIRYGGLPCAAVIDLKDKLTFSVSTTQSEVPVVDVLRTSMPPGFKKVRLNIENQLVPEYPVSNVIGYVEGKEVIDTFIVITAHYDHLGMIGNNTMFRGANDNASGVAMMLSLAKHYSQPANQPKYTIVFIGFAGEEAGLLGSQKLAADSVMTLGRIKFLVNLDMVGTGDEGITVVNATEHPVQFETLQKINAEKEYLVQIKSRGKAANSDHYPFTERGVPGFFIYTMGGIKAYHDIYDLPQTLPLTEFEDLHSLLRDFIATF